MIHPVVTCYLYILLIWMVVGYSQAFSTPANVVNISNPQCKQHAQVTRSTIHNSRILQTSEPDGITR